MFFRREQPKETSFEQRLQALRQAGFSVEPIQDRRVRVSRGGCAAVIEDVPGGPPRVVERAGILFDGAIARLTDEGYQKFFRTPDGRRKPALAHELKAVHKFEEDLREALGLQSLYNESLGTVSRQYLYDRVEDRDYGVPRRVWER